MISLSDSAQSSASFKSARTWPGGVT